MNHHTQSRSELNLPSALDAWFSPARFAVVLALLTFAAYPEVIFGQQTFYFRDYGFFGYPLAFHYRESFWRGEIPLWNPLNDCGLPFLAQWNTLVLYPGSLFYLLLPVSWALGVFSLGHLFMAGMGMYFLAASWTGNRLAASVAGVAFAFNGLSFNCLMWPNNIAAIGWMPWVVWFAERALKGGRRVIVWSALAGSMQMLSGAPEIICLTWFIVGLLVVNQMFQSPQIWRTLWRRFLLVVGVIVGLTAAQLLPFFDLLVHSQRQPGFANADWAMPETGWANLLVPLFRCYQHRQGVFFQDGQYWTSSYYLGIGVLALAVFAVWQVRDRRVWLLGAVTAMSLILAMGDHGYLYAWLRHTVPAFSFMRYPIKFVVLAVFCMPLLAAFAVRQYQDSSVAVPAYLSRAITILWVVLLTATGGIIWFDYLYPLFKWHWTDTWQSGLSRAVFLTLILGTLFSLGRFHRQQFRILASFGLLLLIGLDALTHAPRQNPTAPRVALEPGLLKLDPQPEHGKTRAMLTPAADVKLRVSYTTKPLNDYICSRLGLFSNCNLLDAIPKLNGFYSLFLRSERDVWSLLYESANQPLPALYDFLGVSQITAPGKYFEWEKRSSYLPLATIGQKPLFVDDTASLQALTRTDFNPRQVVYLPLDAKGSIHVTNSTQAEITASRFGSHRALIEVQADQPSLVVVAQAYYHCWQAYVDEKPVALWRANHAFQALEVPAGKHQVKLIYRDRSFCFGAIISTITLLGCVVAEFWMRERVSPNDKIQTGRIA